MRHAPIVAVAAAFLATRLYLLLAFSATFSDVVLYRHYATLDAAGVRGGMSLWQATETGWEKATAAATARGTPPPLPETRIVEYPPLALAPIVVAARLVPPTREETGWPARFTRFFRAEMFVVDLATFVLLAAWTRRRRVVVLALYTAGGALLPHVLYDRLDLVVGALVAAALALLVGRRHIVWAWLVLAVAVAYKLAPVALVPLFAIGSLPATAIVPGRGLSRAGIVRAGAFAASGVALSAIALVAPALRWGTTTLAFLAYHRERALQIESPLATLLLVLARLTGQPYAVARRYGAIELFAPAADELASLSPLLVALVTIVATLWLVRALARLPATSDDTRLAARHPQLFVDGAILTLLATMLVSKVLSPQYLVWLVPLVPLVRRTRFGIAFCAVAAVTTLIYPYLYLHHILRYGGDPPWPGPTGLGIALLALRNGGLAALTIWLARELAASSHSDGLA